MSREVPSGWSSGRLGDLVALEYGKSLPEANERRERYQFTGRMALLDITLSPSFMVPAS